MNEWIKKLLEQLKNLWGKWSLVQKIILIGIVVVVIVALILIARVSSTPSTTALFGTAITDETQLANICIALDNNNIEYTQNGGIISVADKTTAQRARIILNESGLLNNIDPWDIFDVERWTTTDFERNVNLQRAITDQLELHIKALNDIDDVSVNIEMGRDSLFNSEPTRVSVILSPKPNSDITTNRKRLEGIQSLIINSVGVTAENLTITDKKGIILNDFEGMTAFDELDIAEKQHKQEREREAALQAQLLSQLQDVYGEDRVRNLSVNVELDFDQRSSESTVYSPVILEEDNPNTPFSEFKYVETLPLSSETVYKESKGTVYNPEGPSGVEGQNSPVYSDMNNMYTVTTEKGEKVNNVINTSQISEQKSLGTTKRITVSVNVDGSFTPHVDENGDFVVIKDPRGSYYQYDYEPLSAEDLAGVRDLIAGKIGYDESRGDRIYPTSLRIDRISEWQASYAEDERERNARLTVIYVCIGVATVLLAFIIFRIISRELERKRRLKEEETLRKARMDREKTLWEAEQAGMEVTMSVEERERAELQENAIGLAKEHPEDVAMLIRTWLMEE